MAYLTKIKTRLAIHAHRRISGLLDGQYASLHTGRSLDFADLREYVIGDDVKDIDWKATARHREPLIKRYVADRKHTIVLAVGTGCEFAAHANAQETKAEVALAVGGLLGYLALAHGDYVGLYATNGSDIEAARPSTREINVERMLASVDKMCTLEAQPADIVALLEFAIGATHRRNIILLIVDDIDFNERITGLLQRLVAQHDLLLVTVGDIDPADPALEGEPLMQLGHNVAFPYFVAHDHGLQRELAAEEAERHRRRDDVCRRLGIPREHLKSSDESIGAVVRLLESTKRVRR